MNITEVFAKTDWPLLAKQKEALVWTEMNPELLDGLLAWIDAVQDAAEAEGFPVYPEEKP
jgi:hypothetical protein